MADAGGSFASPDGLPNGVCWSSTEGAKHCTESSSSVGPVVGPTEAPGGECGLARTGETEGPSSSIPIAGPAGQEASIKRGDPFYAGIEDHSLITQWQFKAGSSAEVVATLDATPAAISAAVEGVGALTQSAQVPLGTEAGVVTTWLVMDWRYPWRACTDPRLATSAACELVAPGDEEDGGVRCRCCRLERS